MMARRFGTAWGWVGLPWVLASCVGPPPAPPANDDSSTGPVAASSSSGAGASATSVADGTGTSTSTSASGPLPTTTEGTTTDGGETCTPVGALGDACSDAACDCFSGNCFMIGVLGGVCSECDESADCKPEPGFGCNAGNPLSMFPAVCSTTGDLGEGCETAEDCAGVLRCVMIIDVPGIVTASTCSQCDPEQSCDGAFVCSPTYDLNGLAGYYRCVEPGTVPNGEGCNPLAGGAECVSGQCVSASLMGISVVTVCSECDEDADCQAGHVCQLPEVVVEGDTLVLVPGACV